MLTAGRWLAVLPVALLTYAFMQALLIALSLLLALPEVANSAITQLLAAFVCPYYFIYIGAKVAPKSRAIVALLLVVTNALISGGLIMYSFIVPATARPISADAPLWWLILDAAIGVTVSIFAYLRVQAEEKTPQPTSMNWKRPVYRILSNVFVIVYAYGYFGQGILYLSIATNGFQPGWGLLRLLFFPWNMFEMLTTWYFWVLAAVAGIGYFGGEYFAKQADAALELATDTTLSS